MGVDYIYKTTFNLTRNVIDFTKKNFYAYYVPWKLKCQIRFHFSQCGNYGHSLSRNFGKNFVKVNNFTKWVTKDLIWLNFHFGEREFLVFPHCTLITIDFTKKALTHRVKIALIWFSLKHFWQKFCESNVFTKEITKDKRFLVSLFFVYVVLQNGPFWSSTFSIHY